VKESRTDRASLILATRNTGVKPRWLPGTDKHLKTKLGGDYLYVMIWKCRMKKKPADVSRNRLCIYIILLNY
jgi:hypothetical protein